MKQRIRFHLRERLRRIHFIKLELNKIVHNSITKNKYSPIFTNLSTNLLLQTYQFPKYSISRHRIICPLNSSFKLVNKAFRLSRFSLNNLARTNNISGLLRRG
jgi:hypothetical protein